MSEDLHAFAAVGAFVGVCALLIYALLNTRRGKSLAVSRSCKACGHVGKPVFQTPGSLVVELMLWGLMWVTPTVLSWPIFNGLGVFKLPFLLLTISGPIYSSMRILGRKNTCAKCGSRDLDFSWNQQRENQPFVGHGWPQMKPREEAPSQRQQARRFLRIGSNLEQPESDISGRKHDQT